MGLAASGCASLPADQASDSPSSSLTQEERAPSPVETPPPAIVLPGQAEGLSAVAEAADADSPQNAQPIHSGNLLDRIRDGFALPELPHGVVQPYIARYQRNPELLRRPFDRGSPYLHHIVEQIESRGMPLELALLPIVESAFNPQATSHAKAAGIWQFIPSTGRAFNLSQDWWRDERRDIVSSTEAALEYLSRITALHGGDWFLGLASYNWGEGAVQRAVRAAKARGLSGDYLSLRMPRETRQYVPQLIALRNILRRPEQYGLTLPHVDDRPAIAMLEKEQSIDLALAAKFAGLEMDEFKMLNPHLHRPVLSVSRTSRLVLPIDRIDQYQAQLAQYEQAKIPLVTWLPRTLKKGENLRSVADQSGLTVQALASANGLSPIRRLTAGTTILAPSRRLLRARAQGEARLLNPVATTAPRAPRAQPAAREVAQVTASVATAVAPAPSAAATDETTRQIEAALAGFSGLKTVEAPSLSRNRYYRVRKNDTLSAIASRFSISVSRLRQLNRLKSTIIRPGMQLKVRG